jgi:hypothetical protein
MSDHETPLPRKLPAEVPEADALDQAEEVEPTAPPRTDQPPYEVPEADAWDQAQEVPLDDDCR